MVRSNTSCLALLLACGLGTTACQVKDGDGAGTEGTGRYAQNGQGGVGDGCAGVPQQFPDGFAFDRHSDGRVKKGLIVKVIRDANAAYGANAGYVQKSPSSPDPSRVTVGDLGRYGATAQVYGYSGGAFDMVSTASGARIYRADGSEDISSTYGFSRSGNNVVMNLVTGARMGKQIGQGRFLSKVNGVDHYVFHAVNGACFGTAAVRGREAGMSGGQQHSVEGGSFVVYLGSGGSSGGSSGGGQPQTPQNQQRPPNQQNQQRPPNQQNQQRPPNQQNQQRPPNQQNPVPSQQVPVYMPTPKATATPARTASPVNNQQQQSGSTTQQGGFNGHAPAPNNQQAPIFTK